MGDISNKTLVGLLVVAIIVSLAGTMVSLHRLGKLSLPIFMMGQATGTGTAEIRIEAVVGITMVDNLINFSSGYVNPGAPWGEIPSDDVTAKVNWTNTSALSNDWFVIENNGTAPVNLTIALDKADAEEWLCGGTCTSNYATVWTKAANNESGACSGTIKDTYTELANHSTTTTVLLCSKLESGDADRLNAYLKVRVPYDVPSPGKKEATFTFTAEQVS